MARAIRQVGLRLLVALLRAITPEPPAGWRPVTRPPDDLAGR